MDFVKTIFAGPWNNPTVESPVDRRRREKYFVFPPTWKNNYCNKLITKLNVGENVITDPMEILEGRTFYNRQYSDNDNHISNHIWEEISDKFTISEYLLKLNENEKISCEGALTGNEPLKSIKAFKNGKIPGTDGLTAEFYKFFCSDIKRYLLDSINFALENGIMSVEQRRAIISLLPKIRKRSSIS